MLSLRRVTAVLSIVVVGGVATLAAGAISSGTPDQATNDQASANASFQTGGLWGDMPGGVAARPCSWPWAAWTGAL